MKAKLCGCLTAVLCAAVPARVQGQMIKHALTKAVARQEAKALISGLQGAESRTRMTLLAELKKNEYARVENFAEYFVNRPSFPSSDAFRLRNETLEAQLLDGYFEKSLLLRSSRDVIARELFTRVHTGRIDYVKMIPSRAQVILLGEAHEVPSVAAEVSEIIKQYAAAYPKRNIYYASEFVDAADPSLPFDRWAVTRREINSRVTKRPFYTELTRAVQVYGVTVIGLENPAVSAAVVAENYRSNWSASPSAQKYASLAGMEERNLYWANIIDRIFQEDPSAVVFVHAGMAHTSYNIPSSLPHMLSKRRKFVIELATHHKDGFHSLLEEYAPVGGKAAAQVRAVKNNTPALYHKLRIVRATYNRDLADGFGCHVQILFPAQK